MSGRRDLVKKRGDRQRELHLKLWTDKTLTRKEKDLIILELMELSIEEGSRWWRYGCKGVLKRARKAIEQQETMGKLWKSPSITITSDSIQYNAGDGIPPACRYCSNHPSNGGSGICHCTLGTTPAICSVEGHNNESY